MNAQSSKRGRRSRYWDRGTCRKCVVTRSWFLPLVWLSLIRGAVNPPWCSKLPIPWPWNIKPQIASIPEDTCREACAGTYVPDLDVWPDKLTVYMWEKCPKVYGMCSLACWSLQALKQEVMLGFRYDEDGDRVGGIGGADNEDLHDMRNECIQCCYTEVGKLNTNSTLTEQLVRYTTLEFVDLHVFLHLPYQIFPVEILELLSLLPNVPSFLWERKMPDLAILIDGNEYILDVEK